MRTCFKLLSLAMLMLVSTSSGISQKRGDITECKSNIANPVKFKVLRVSPSIREPFTLGIDVAVRKKDFNREFMIRFAQTIRARYCMENAIGVAIVDDKKVFLADPEIIAYHLGGIKKSPVIRGFYSFNRLTGVNVIGFSTKRGNPDDEIVIDFSNHSEPEYQPKTTPQ
jgi:hypothetical protein